MAQLFAAYDHQWYQRLIPSHIADIHRYPREVIEYFKKVGFTVRLQEGLGIAVALDEAHEMCINRDIKKAVASPTWKKQLTSFLIVSRRRSSLLHRYFCQLLQNLQTLPFGIAEAQQSIGKRMLKKCIC